MVSSDPLSVFLCLSVLLYVANGDYQCICNYNVETGVMPAPSAQGSPVGFLYEFDCKQNIEALNTAKWLAVAFEHKVGYVQINDDIQTQICPGEIPPVDIVTTTTTATASSTTTRLTTTAAAAPTTMSSTPRTPSDQSTSTTQSATTRQPATTTQSTTTTKATTRQPTTTTQPTSTKQSTTTRESTTTRKLTTTTKPTTTIRPTTSMRPTTTTLKPMTIIYSKTTAQTARNLTTPMVVNVVSGKPKLCPAKLLSRVEYDRNILTQYGDHCYEVVSNQMDTWLNAEAYCSKFGGHLVSVGSSGEQIFITNFLKHNFYHEVWIGFNDRGSANQFLWSSGDKVTFTNWDPTSSGVMSTGNNLRNCVVLSPSDNGLWNNRKCQLSKSYICKYAINSPQTITRPGTTQTTATDLKSSTASTSLVSGKPSLCPSFMRNHASQAGSLLAQYGDKCYETVTTKELSWSQAERYCNRYGGHLITINNNMEQAYIYNFIKQNYRHTVWIGLTDSRKEGTFLWASGQKPVYLHWYNEPLGFLHLTDSYEDCAVLTINHNGLWDDRDCYSTHNFICEYRLDGIPMVSTPAPTVPATNAYGISAPGDTSRCPSQVQSLVRRDSGKLGYYKNSCYEVIPNSKVSHDHAVQMCRERGGELVDILNSQEQSFVQSFLELYSPQHAVWIGLHDRNQENYFEWTSGAAAQYTHWIPGHTSNFVSHKQEDCVLIIPYKNGLWDDIPCGSSSYFFGDSGEIYPPLCEYKVSTFTGNSFIG